MNDQCPINASIEMTTQVLAELEGEAMAIRDRFGHLGDGPAILDDEVVPMTEEEMAAFRAALEEANMRQLAFVRSTYGEQDAH
jgi:hypothetical protein